MGDVAFSVRLDLDHPPKRVWEALTDWRSHEQMVPQTTIEMEHEDPTGVGTIFTATTGIRPIALVDRMRVDELAWDDESGSGFCRIDKLGPILSGWASLRVTPAESGSVVDWVEDVDVVRVPSFAAPVVARVAAFSFRVIVGYGLRRMLRQQA